MRIGIVIGSIRDGRKGEAVGHWVARRAAEIRAAHFEVLDLKDFDLPLLTAPTAPAAANKAYDSPPATRWSQAVDACDGFVFVTAEYNHGMPGAFKNAVDTLGPEWAGKTVAFVSYGAQGGVRAVEQWRQVLAGLRMLDVSAQVSLSLHQDFGLDGFNPEDRRDTELATLFEELAALTGEVVASTGPTAQG